MKFRWKQIMPQNKTAIAITAGVSLLCAGTFGAIAAAQVAAPEAVEIAALPTDAFAIGVLETADGALPPSLWKDSDPQVLDYLLSHAPVRPASPSLGQAMRRTLLSSGAKPVGADASLGGKKLLALTRAGFVSEARDIASLASSGRNDLFVAEADATINLLSGDVDGACRRGAALAGGREALFWVKLRAFCYARAGELDAYDLTMNLLREHGSLSATEEALFAARAPGAQPKVAPPITTALEYAAAKSAGVLLNPGLLEHAEGGVLSAIVMDSGNEPALRIEAAEHALAAGTMNAGTLVSLFDGVDFDVADIGAALDIAAARPNDPLTDALLYQSIAAMDAPEFIRDKAQRISLALDRANSFPRAHALALVYAEKIDELEGVLVSPGEAANFALARMAVGDSIGAGRWLAAMIGANESVAALPEPLAGIFIDRVNLLALVDPQTAAHIARDAGVSILSQSPSYDGTVSAHDDHAVTARILEAAFDAVAGDKAGQAGLAALAASAGSGKTSGEVEAVVVSESLNAAGMPELRRRHRFERAWAASFAAAPATELGSASVETPAGAAMSATPISAQASDDDGLWTPRVKPSKGQ